MGVADRCNVHAVRRPALLLQRHKPPSDYPRGYAVHYRHTVGSCTRNGYTLVSRGRQPRRAFDGLARWHHRAISPPLERDPNRPMADRTRFAAGRAVGDSRPLVFHSHASGHDCAGNCQPTARIWRRDQRGPELVEGYGYALNTGIAAYTLRLTFKENYRMKAPQITRLLTALVAVGSASAALAAEPTISLLDYKQATSAYQDAYLNGQFDA